MPDFDVLNTFDWIIFGVMLISIITGVWRGFSNELFGLIGLIASFVITSFAGKILDGPMSAMLPDNAMGHMFGRAIVFLACLLVINLAASLAASSLRAALSRPVDHSIGLLFGFLRGALTVMLPFLLVNLYIDPKVYPDWLTEAHSYPFLENGAHLLRQVLPKDEIRDGERTDFGELKKAAEEEQKQLDDANDAAHKKAEKGKKKVEDSTGNSKWKDIFMTLKEVFPH